MIQVTRPLLRQLRTVLRKCRPAHAGRRQFAVFQATGKELKIRVQACEAGVQYACQFESDPEEIAIPVEMLDRAAGTEDTAVSIERSPSAMGVIHWQDGGIPQSAGFESPEADRIPEAPKEPDRMAINPASLIRALRDAMETIATQPHRYAIDHIQLRGKSGQIVATDGRELLIQSGFDFPWNNHLLVPALGVFGCRDLELDLPIQIGSTDSHITLRVGPWTVYLRINSDGRFPKVDPEVPEPEDAVATVRFTHGDLLFLSKSLPRLPGNKDDRSPVTLDCNGSLVVRAKAEGQHEPTELVLSDSQVSGQPVQYATDRRYLGRALAIGFSELSIFSEERPILCQDDKRQYIWKGLTKDMIVPRSDAAVRIEASDQPVRRRKNTTSNNGTAQPMGSNQAFVIAETESASPSGEPESRVLEEIQAVRRVLKDAYDRVDALALAINEHAKRPRSRKATRGQTALAPAS